MQSRGMTREQLLDAAGDLMIERDSLEISLMDIAVRAGVNAAMVKYYFGNKEGLLLALLERDARGTLNQLLRLMAMDLPPDEKLKRHLVGVMRVCFQRPYINRLVVAVLRDQPANRRQQVADLYIRPMTDFYARVAEDGAAAGLFRPVDPMMLYFQAVGICDNIVAARVILPTIFGIDALSADQREQYIEQTLAIFLAGVRAPDARS
jgi:TetR/AcrR family transcriptional regulator